MLLTDISNAAEKIVTYTTDMNFTDFIDNEITIDAVIRNFSIIGEAVSKIPMRLKDDYDNIEWRLLSDFRNRLVHEYFQIDFEVVWKITQEKLGDLVDLIDGIIKDLIDKNKEEYYH